MEYKYEIGEEVVLASGKSGKITDRWRAGGVNSYKVCVGVDEDYELDWVRIHNIADEENIKLKR